MEVGRCDPFLSPRETGRPQREARGKPFRLGFPLDPFPKRPEGRGCGPFLWNPSPGAAAGREAGRIDNHPGMRCYVTTCGISVGGEARCSALGWSWTNLRKAGYQPSHPQTCPDGQVWTKRLFLPPCTAHSFSPRRKRMGGAMPARLSTHSPPGNQANSP